MEDEFSNAISHCLSPISRGQRGSLGYNKCSDDVSEYETSITDASVFLETPSYRSSSENSLKLDCFAFCNAGLAFKASRFDFSPHPNALHNGLGAVLNAPSGCPQAGA
jgi:hypothetical protein